MEKLIPIILLLLAPLSSKGQTPVFYGGDGDGHGDHCYTQAANLRDFIYYGGDHDGSAVNCFIQTSHSELYNGGGGDGFSINCYEQDIIPVFEPFTGGHGDGSAVYCYQQEGSLGATIYKGGDGDGFDLNCYGQDPMDLKLPFYGGNGDGSAVYCYQQEESLGAAIYKGGDGDGFHMDCYEQDPMDLKLPFYGGHGDGFDAFCYQQEESLGEDIYNGGDGDGFDVKCYEQGIVQVFGQFTGGDGDGSAHLCFSQESALGSQLFLGGGGDGFDVDCFEQMLFGLIGSFYGGDGDGADFHCYLQSDYLIKVPIELAHFYARPIRKRRVELSWQTQSEINNDYFVIERSRNGIDWEYVQELLGAGNSSILIDYSYIDDDPYDGISYYRLKQVDFDGRFSYSFVRSVDLNGINRSTNELLIYPNPATNLINFQFDKFIKDELILTVYTIQGQLVFNEKVYLNNGQGIYSITDLSVLGAGSYVVSISDQNAIHIRQLFVVK